MDKRIAAALLAVLLCGCSQRTEPVSEPLSESAVSSQSEPVTVVTSDTEPSEVIMPDTAEASAGTECPSAETEAPEDTVQPAATEERAETAEVSVSDTASESTAAATVQTTTAPPVEPEPVNIVIPEVRVPLSPGIETASNDKVLVDYSNASEGYISVCWSDTGKLVKLRMICGDRTYDHDVATGGVTEYFPLSCGSGTYTVQIYEQTEGSKYAKSLEQEFTAEIKNELSPFLYPNKYVYFDSGSASVEKAAVLCAGKSGTIEKTAAVFQWITDNVTYDRQLAATVQSGYIPDPDKVLKKKSGICYDYASLMAAMLRSQEIPTRLVIGYAADNIYHAWNEIWTEETGWITPELLLSGHGYNITDATFYAGSADKKKIAGYISDSGNYSALYYY